MGTLNDARNKTAANPNSVSNGGNNLAPTITPESLIQIPSPPLLDLPVAMPQRGIFPPTNVLVSDRSANTRAFRSQNMRSPVFQTPSNPQPASIVSAPVTAAQIAAALAILVNNQATPDQDVLNFLNSATIQWVAGANGQISANATVAAATSDGLDHGQTVLSPGSWESDPAYVILRDDFISQNTTASNSGGFLASQIGALGWAIYGATPTNGGFFGGSPPYVGQYGWSNNSSAGQAGWLSLPTPSNYGGTIATQGGMALAETPGTLITFVFKLQGGLNSSLLYSDAQKALYVGLVGTTGNNTGSTAPVISRPDVFIGLRYDTSTSSPSINDSFYTLEVVSNTTFSTLTRNNTQGTTFVTNVAPAQDVWHRVDILFSAAGTVTITLDESSTNTLTATIPKISITATGGTGGGLAQNGNAVCNWNPSASIGVSPWAPGSEVTVSGYTSSGAPLNGVHTLISGNDGSQINFPLAGTIGTQSGSTPTFVGYPAFCPCIVFGNDDTAAPTGLNAWLFVDYFSMIWNPAISAAGGTPVATNPRYF